MAFPSGHLPHPGVGWVEAHCLRGRWRRPRRVPRLVRGTTCMMMANSIACSVQPRIRFRPMRRRPSWHQTDLPIDLPTVLPIKGHTIVLKHVRSSPTPRQNGRCQEGRGAKGGSSVEVGPVLEGLSGVERRVVVPKAAQARGGGQALGSQAHRHQATAMGRAVIIPSPGMRVRGPTGNSKPCTPVSRRDARLASAPAVEEPKG